MTLAVSDVLGIDFKQNLEAPVKAQLPEPGPRGVAFPGPASGSRPRQDPSPGHGGASRPNAGRWARKRFQLLKGETEAEEGSREISWRRPSVPSPGETPQCSKPRRAKLGQGGAATGLAGRGPPERCLNSLLAPTAGIRALHTAGAYLVQVAENPGDLGPPSIWLEEASRPGGWLSRVVTTGRGWGGRCRVA